MKRRQVKKNISTGQMPAPMGFRTASATPPQIVPGSTSGSSNVAAIRSTFAFLPYNADEVNKRIFAAKVLWQQNNPDKAEDEFPGMKDLYGTGDVSGAGSKFLERQKIAKTCSNGQVYVEKNNRCECPGSTLWCDVRGKCTLPEDCRGQAGRPGDPFQLL
jgi:hypothetical protein